MMKAIGMSESRGLAFCSQALINNYSVTGRTRSGPNLGIAPEKGYSTRVLSAEPVDFQYSPYLRGT
jgi:hypothetical protein